MTIAVSDSSSLRKEARTSLCTSRHSVHEQVGPSRSRLLALAGGWPGALLAQQLLRHKSTKVEFRKVFWGTVIINVAGFALWCSPFGQPLRALL